MPYARGRRLLGRKPGAVHDDRTLHLASLLTPAVPTPPKRWRIATANHDWPPYGNFEFGDCTRASLSGHRVIAQEWWSRSKDQLGPPTEPQVLESYFRITGGADTGAYLIDALRDERKIGTGREADGTPHTILAYAKVDHTDWEQMKLAAWMFGGLYLGLALPAAAEDEINAGKQWTAVTGPGTDPYGWGGHAVWQIGYDERGRIQVPTWTVEQWATGAWRQKFVDEAWCVISEDQFNRLGRTPQGLDVRALETYLARLG